MRYVQSVASVRDAGIDPDFYTGSHFVPIPATAVKPLRKWCGANLSSITLGKEGPDDDPIEVYVLVLSKKDEIAGLKKVLSIVLSETVASVSASPPKDVFAKKGDTFFDTLRASADLRDFILRVEGEIKAVARAGTIVDPAILIEV